MALTAYYLSPEHRLDSDLDDGRVRSALESGAGVLWVDITEPDAHDRELLVDVFGFHPLAVDNVVNPEAHSVRVEDFGQYVYISAQSVDYTLDEDVLQTAELGVFVAPTFVVTVHSVYMPSVEAIRRLVEVDGRPMMRGGAFFAYSHLQALLEAITPALDRMSERADAIEDRILTDPDESALTALMTLKRSSLSLSRALAPQREVLSRLGRREFETVGQGADLYFRDLFEYLVRVQASNDVIRERADTSLATYLSAVANRQNEIMKVLSIVATMFMPLGLIVGIFGMNFENMPGTEYPWGYHIVWVVALIAVGLVLWMLWLKRWIVGGSRALRSRRLPRFVPTDVDPARLRSYIGRTAARTLRWRTLQAAKPPFPTIRRPRRP